MTTRVFQLLAVALLAGIVACSPSSCSGGSSNEGEAVSTPPTVAPPPAHRADSESWEVSDPYCGMRLSRSEAAATHEHRGVRYYFCIPDHRDTFARDPDRYLAANEEDQEEPTDGGAAVDAALVRDAQ